MAWIEVHSDLPDHPKTIYCADLLHIDRDLLVSKLIRLWTWAIDYRDNGCFLAEEGSMIAEKMRWPKHSKKAVQQLINALCAVPPGERAGFLVKTDTGYSIYNWGKYAGKLLDRRRKDRVRKHGKSSEIQGNSDGIPQEIRDDSAVNPKDVQRNSECYRNPNRNPNRNPTKLSAKRQLAASTVEEPPQPFENPDFGKVMSHYQQTLGTCPSPIVIQDVRDYLSAGMSADVLCEAVDETARANPSRPAAYFRRIAEAWKREGIRSMESLRAYKSRQPRGAPPGPDISNPQSYREEELPEWARKPAKS